MLNSTLVRNLIIFKVLGLLEAQVVIVASTL